MQKQNEILYVYGYVITVQGETKRVVLGEVYGYDEYLNKKHEIDSANFVAEGKYKSAAKDSNVIYFIEQKNK